MFIRRKFRWFQQPWRWLPFALRLAIARVRAWLIRHRALRRLIVAVIVVVPIGVTATALGRADAAQRSWGETVEVLIVDANVATGEALRPKAVRLVRRPTEFLPEDALREPLQDVEVATRALHEGDVLTRRDIRSMRDTLDLPAGFRAVSLPADPRLPPVQVGDGVDVYVLDSDVGFGQVAGETRRLDDVAIVLDVTDDSITLAVADHDVVELISASSLGRVFVALR